MADPPERIRRRGQSVARSRRPDSAEPGEVPPEVVRVVLRGIGASLFLTDEHLIFARDGAHRRPRKGHRALTIDAIQFIGIELGSGSSGRIVVRMTDGQEAVSMFFDARSLDRAHELVDITRWLIARSRRGRSGTEPAG